MSQDKVNELMASYMSAEQKQAFYRSVAALPADFDNDAHNLKWKALSDRIKAALPMDPPGRWRHCRTRRWRRCSSPTIAG